MGPVAIFTNDIYKRYIKPNSSELHLVRVARYATLILGILAIVTAYLIPNVLDLILCAFWSMLLGGSSAVIYSIIGEPFGFAASYLGWIIGLPTLVIVSLMSDHSPEENPDLFI